MSEENSTKNIDDNFSGILSEFRQLALEAKRYRYLRRADIDSIDIGGVFVGKTPDNVVINGVNLDEEIDALILLKK